MSTNSAINVIVSINFSRNLGIFLLTCDSDLTFDDKLMKLGILLQFDVSLTFSQERKKNNTSVTLPMLNVSRAEQLVVSNFWMKETEVKMFLNR